MSVLSSVAEHPPTDAKSPRPVSRRGLNSFDDELMPVICPTCQALAGEQIQRKVFLSNVAQLHQWRLIHIAAT